MSEYNGNDGIDNIRKRARAQTTHSKPPASDVFVDLGVDNIMERLQDTASRQKIALQAIFLHIFIPLLKLDYFQSDQIGYWIDEINEERRYALSRLEQNPGLGPYALALLEKAWQQARLVAEKSFSAYGAEVIVHETCPYTLEQLLDTDFIPHRWPTVEP